MGTPKQHQQQQTHSKQNQINFSPPLCLALARRKRTRIERSSHRSSRGDDEERGHRSSRHRSRSRDRTRSHRDDRDRDRDRDEDRRRPRDDDRDRDYRSSRRYEDERRERRDREPQNGGPRDDRDNRRDDRDRRGPPLGRDYGPPRRDNRRDDRPRHEPMGKQGVSTIFGSPRRRSPTPEGTIPISRRKRVKTGWDVKPHGLESITALQAKLTGRFNLPGQARPSLPANFGMAEIQNSAAYMPPIAYGTFLDNFPEGITYARQSRRLYVGNVDDMATEETITEFFNSEMRRRKLAIDDKVDVENAEPVVMCTFTKEKNYAFLELRSSEEAAAAMALEGASFMKQALQVRRPKDYLGDNLLGTGPGAGLGNVADSPNKLFVGGLPSYLTEDQIVELLKAFGELKAFNLVKEGTGSSKGFAFAEYLDPEVTDVACQGLNGMELGDRYLVVQRASLGMGAGRGAAANYGPPQDVTTMALRSAPNVVAGAASEGQPTRVLQMLNMVTPDELVDDQDYEDLLEDIKEECGKFGEILELKIPRPLLNDSGRLDPIASEKVANLGKIFVMFDSTEATKKALRTIAGRQFGGRTVLCAYADEVVLLQ